MNIMDWIRKRVWFRKNKDRTPVYTLAKRILFDSMNESAQSTVLSVSDKMLVETFNGAQEKIASVCLLATLYAPTVNALLDIVGISNRAEFQNKWTAVRVKSKAMNGEWLIKFEPDYFSLKRIDSSKREGEVAPDAPHTKI